MQKIEKSYLENQDFKFLSQNKKIIKALVAIITSLVFVIAIITIIIVKLNAGQDADNANKPPHKDTENLKSHQILTKQDWLGKEPKSFTKITPPVDLVIIKHTGGGTCDYFQICAGKVQTIQGTDIANGKPDIYCNFLIGGDGNIYVGRGWDVRNEQRDGTIDIVFMGNFDTNIPNDSMFEAALLLIDDGVKKKKIESNYKVVCHNQTANIRSPGINVIKEVVKWPHYDSGLHFPHHLVSQEFQSMLHKLTKHEACK